MKHSDNRTATLKQLKTYLRNARKSYKNSEFPKVDGNWRTTSKNNPTAGSIFMNIPFATVTFTDKYGNLHKGILNKFQYEKTQGIILANVLSNKVNPFYDGDNMAEGCLNCLVHPASLTLISGSIQEIPNTPNMEKIKNFSK